MVLFWTLAALMAALAVAFVVAPLLRARVASAPTTAEANLEVLRAQRRELEADVAAGTLAPAAHDEALAELQLRAAQDVQGDDRPVAPARKPWALAGAVALLLPVLAFALYLHLGQPRAADPALMAMMKGPADEQQVTQLVETLAQKVRERPDDVRGWSLLARSMAALGRYRESADAYEHLAKLEPRDPTVLADYADVLGMAQGRSLAGKPAELARAALALEPDHPKALALAGTAALDSGDYKAAIGYWEHLAATMPPDSPDAPQVRQVIEEIRQRAAQAGQKLPAPTAVASASQPTKAAPTTIAAAAAPGPAAAAGSVTGTVAVAPEIAPRIKGSETLFVYARAENGPRMPLAIVRTHARELPMKFALDDSQSMAPTMKLSGATAVRIEARVSASGNATPQAGDLVGTSEVVKPGTQGVRVVLDKVVP